MADAQARARLERLERDGKQLIDRTQAQLEQMREPAGAEGFPFGPSREVAQFRREAERTDITEDQRESLKLQEQQLSRKTASTLLPRSGATSPRPLASRGQTR